MGLEKGGERVSCGKDQLGLETGRVSFRWANGQDPSCYTYDSLLPLKPFLLCRTFTVDRASAEINYVGICLTMSVQ